MFGTVDTDRAHDFIGTDPANATLSATVQQLWASFAASGTPKATGVIWPLYDTTRRPTFILDHRPGSRSTRTPSSQSLG